MIAYGGLSFMICRNEHIHPFISFYFFLFHFTCNISLNKVNPSWFWVPHLEFFYLLTKEKEKSAIISYYFKVPNFVDFWVHTFVLGVN